MPRYMIALQLCCLIALAATPLAAQRSADSRATPDRRFTDRDDDQATIDTTISFASSGGVVDLNIASGEITVTGWNRPEARIHVTSDDDNAPVHFEHGPDRILLDARRGGRWHGDDNDVQYDLTVPVGTRVLMHSASGDLHARGTHGEIEARSISGDVVVDDVVRGATLESVSGEIQARTVDGDLRARSVSGDIDLDAVTGDITVSSVSGHAYISGARARVARMESVSGDLSYTGPLDPTGTYDFRAHSGNVRLELPADAGALLSIDTFSGDIDTDFPLTIGPSSDNGPPRHHVDTTLGSGGAHVTISTFSGDIELKRAGHSHSGHSD
jgi:Putative adhesin